MKAVAPAPLPPHPARVMTLESRDLLRKWLSRIMSLRPLKFMTPWDPRVPRRNHASRESKNLEKKTMTFESNDPRGPTDLSLSPVSPKKPGQRVQRADELVGMKRHFVTNPNGNTHYFTLSLSRRDLVFSFLFFFLPILLHILGQCSFITNMNGETQKGL